MYVVGYQKEKGLYLHLGDDLNLWGSENPEELTEAITKSYNKCHARSYESSMSACVHMITMQPIIFKIPDCMQEFENMIEKRTDGSLGFQVYNIRSIASPGQKGLKVLDEFKDQLLEYNSSTPELITPEFENYLSENERIRRGM